MSKEVEIVVSAKDNASGTLNSISRNSQSFADKMKKNLNTIRIASGLAFTGLVAMSKNFLEAGMESIAVETKLTTVLKQRTNATDDQIKKIIDLTKVQQKLGVVEDDIQIAGAGQLATFVKTTGAIETLIPAMNNLVAQQSGVNATSQDMVGIANMLGKAMQGNFTVLQRYGIYLTDAQKRIMAFGSEQEKASIISQVLTDKVGNMNEALAGTFQGRLQQLKNTLSDVKETIGIAMIPALQKLIDILMPTINKITERIDKNPELTAKILLVATAVAGLVFAISMIIGPLTTFVGLLGGPFGLVILLGGALVALKLLSDQHQTHAEKVQALNDKMTALHQQYIDGKISMEDYKKGLADLGAEIDIENEKMRNFGYYLQNEFRSTIKSLFSIQPLVDFGTALQQLMDQLVSVIGNAFITVGSTIGNFIANTLKPLITWIKEAVQWINTLLGKQSALSGGAQGKAGGGIQGKAIGGPVEAGVPYMVGENGRELFVPSSNGMIVPNDRLGTQNINIHMGGVTIKDEADENRLVQKISEALKRNQQLYSLGIN